MKKELILIRSLPGAGKTFLANELRHNLEDENYCVAHFETDQLFYIDGKYKWNPKYLKEYHRRTYMRAHDAMADGMTHYVICSNTFTTFKEMQNYILAALIWNYNVVFMEPDTPWAWNVEECAKRNSHGVPLETIQKMKDRYEDTAQCEIKLTQLQLLLRKFK